MGIDTRVDGDLQCYFQAIQDKDYVEEADIQRLLDAYRVKFEVDFVYVGEVLVDRKGLFFTHVSAASPRYGLLGRSHAFRENWESAAMDYDQDGLSEKSLDGADADPGRGILHYAIVRNGEYDGNIGMIDFHRRRQWTAEERTAVQKLGRVLRHILYVERGRKVSAAEQRRLSRQNDALEAVFASADCGIMRHSVDGGELISINRAALDILGYESEEELMENFNLIAESVLDEDKPRLRADIQGLKTVGDSTGMSYRVRHRDGAVLNVVGSVKLMEEDGERFYQRFLIDCTAQKAQEERERLREKRQHEEMIRALSVDFGSVYFVDLDNGTAVPYRMNEDITRRYGDIFVGEISLADSVERYIQDVVYGPDQAQLRSAASVENLAAELAVHDSCYTTYRTCRDGEIEYFQMKAARAGEWEETHRAVLGFRSVDAEIRHEMAQKKLVEEAYEIIAGLSSDYNFIGLLNTETGALSVYMADESLPEVSGALMNHEHYRDAVEAYASYVHEEDRNAWLEGVREETVLEKLRDRKIYNVTVRNSAREKVDYVQFSFTRMAGAHSAQVVLAKRVVTDTIERELQQRAQLEAALAQAERANAAKSTFLSNMSHDIRTPMNAIIGFTTLALKHLNQKDRVREYLTKIMSSGNHLLGLINDVLDMSRIESGKIHIEEHPCSLPEIWHELRNILQSEITAKQLELCIDALDVRNEDIYCDKLRLDQVFLNLLSNAVKFTSTGGRITVRIVEKPCQKEGYASYVFTVADTGIGMSEAFLQRIFEPFERERTSTISGIQGTGLGMAITKNIVDLMEGSISVKSQPGKGTEFTVCLDFRLQMEQREPPVIGELEGCHALVVDDDFNICDSVTGMLSQIGMRAEWTLSGREAVLRTRQAVERGDAYHVYLIDWLMPDMNGVEVARRIRWEVGEQAPIIILSAYDWSDIEEEAKEAGITSFCSKPLFLSELRACLQGIVSPESREDGEQEEEPVRFGAGDRILLAEDNALNREIATELLGEAGFLIETAENGAEAVRKVAASQPGYFRLVLMDVQMPEMNGYEATQAIRKLENRALAELPILAMTANAFEEDRQAALASGMDGHIAKPVDVEKLMATLKDVLNK